jgi:radial spoke head protein 9
MHRSTNTSPELQQFPEVPRKKADAAMALTTRLKGDPTLVLADGDAGGEADPPNQEEGSTTAAPLTELERLACLVEAIDHVIAVTPLESFVVSPMRQVVPNPSFQGLDMERAGQLYNYFHLRQPELPERSRVLTSAASGGLVRPGDFWDPLIQDLDGSWVVSRDNSGAFVTLRNYVFPGAMAFHRVGSGDHGYVYFGDGRRNPDLAFMI